MNTTGHLKKANLFAVLIAFAFTMTSCGSSRSNKSHNAKSISAQKKVSHVAPNFNTDSAYAYVAKQVSFGPRVPGTKAHQKCEDWVVGKLKQWSDTVIIQRFQARTYDGVMRNGQNIIASFSPNNPNRILLLAHWDSRPFADHDKNPARWHHPIMAANDGASGVGVLMEMARDFHEQHPNIGVDIVLTDLEDWGPPAFSHDKGKDSDWALGAQYWAHHPQVPGYSAKFGVLLDMVGAKNPTFLKEYFSVQYAGYYVNEIWNTAAGLGYDNYFPDKPGFPIDDDHIFINKIAGIPTVDIIQQDPKSPSGTFWKWWHTSHDTLDKIDKNTLKAVGEVMMTVVYNQ